MKPATFREATGTHGPPRGMDESQVATIPTFTVEHVGGHLDGSQLVVAAWRPSPEELAQLQAGALVYVSMLVGLAPHFITTSFQEAVNCG